MPRVGCPLALALPPWVAVLSCDPKIIEFRGSPNYRMLTERGFMRLSPWLHQKWLEELEALPPLEPPNAN